MRASLGEGIGDGAAHAGAAASDERHTVLQLQCHGGRLPHPQPRFFSLSLWERAGVREKVV